MRSSGAAAQCRQRGEYYVIRKRREQSTSQLQEGDYWCRVGRVSPCGITYSLVKPLRRRCGRDGQGTMLGRPFRLGGKAMPVREAAIGEYKKQTGSADSMSLVRRGGRSPARSALISMQSCKTRASTRGSKPRNHLAAVVCHHGAARQ